jgi:hypothetical protein
MIAIEVWFLAMPRLLRGTFGSGESFCSTCRNARRRRTGPLGVADEAMSRRTAW